ncbi:hypothetical protein ACEUBM_09415 [Aeromonas caviae]|uniref:hypothetical protein n=1 Tax=Aeromonas caviae TaxID=648 RepID=UPI0038CFE541
MNTSSIFTKAAAQQGERAADSVWDTSLMNYFDEVDSFEDFCKLLAKNIAKAHHGGTNLTDWKVYAKNKHVVHMVVAHYNSVVNQDGIPARWVMKFVAEGLARHLKNKPLWSTVSRGGESCGLPAFVQYINERYPRNQSNIAKHLGVTDRTVHTLLSARSDRISYVLNVLRDRLKNKDLDGLLSDLPDVDKVDKRAKEAIKQIEDNVGSLYCAETGELSLDKLNDLNKKAFGRD